MLKKIIIVLTFAFALSLSIQAVSAAGLLPNASGSDWQSTQCKAPDGSGMDSATYCGDYTLNDFVRLAILASQWILGIVGSLSLIMFIYGGFMFLISSGSSDKVGQAKKIITAAIIGLIIVFSSWLIIRFVTQAIGATQPFNGTVNTSRLINQTTPLI